MTSKYSRSLRQLLVCFEVEVILLSNSWRSLIPTPLPTNRRVRPVRRPEDVQQAAEDPPGHRRVERGIQAVQQARRGPGKEVGEEREKISMPILLYVFTKIWLLQSVVETQITTS